MRKFIASRAPVRDRFGATYREQSATITGLDLLSETPLIYVDGAVEGDGNGDGDQDGSESEREDAFQNLLLPGHRVTLSLSLQGLETFTEMDDVFVVVGRKNDEQLCLARVVQVGESLTESKQAETGLSHGDVLVEGQSRVLLEEVKILELSPEIEMQKQRYSNPSPKLLLCRTSPLLDRWLYFRVLDHLTEDTKGKRERGTWDEALLNVSDALEEVVENVQEIAALGENAAERKKWERVKHFIMQQDGPVEMLDVKGMLASATRASFAALQNHRVLCPFPFPSSSSSSSSSLVSVHERAMKSTDLGERMEMAVAHTKEIKDKLRLNQNFKL